MASYQLSSTEYGTKLKRCVDSILDVSKRLKTEPLKLRRDDWRVNKAKGAPSTTIIQQVGGWEHVKKTANKHWKNDIPTDNLIPNNVDIENDTSVHEADNVPDIDPVRFHRKDLEVRNLKRQNKELVRRASHLEDSIEALTALHSQSIRPAPIRKREKKTGQRECTAVVLCSDWHVEESVFPEQINGRNEYTPEIAQARVRNMVTGIRWLLEMYKSKMAIRDLVLWLGGDLITGFIHEELQETNAYTPIEASMFLQELIANDLIQPLLDNTDLERIIIPCSYGNHGRMKKRKQFKNASKQSYEWMVYHALKHRFRDEPRLEFHIANGAHVYLNVYNKTMRFHHGDDVKYGGGVGGIMIPINKAIDRWNDYIPADITCIGHFHQYMSLPYAVTNGSLIGYNEFALAIKAKYEPPQQAFFLVDSERGKRNSTRIWVDDESMEGTLRESFENEG